LEILYWKIYGTGHITNNELYLWLVKGWIAKTKGHPINWATVVVATVQKKAQHVSIGSLLKGPFANSSDYNDKCEKQGVTFQRN
jgi:hypothetical protein